MLLNCFTCVSVLELSHFDGKSGQAKIRVAKASGTAAHIIASSYTAINTNTVVSTSPLLIFLRMWASNAAYMEHRNLLSTHYS